MKQSRPEACMDAAHACEPKAKSDMDVGLLWQQTPLPSLSRRLLDACWMSAGTASVRKGLTAMSSEGCKGKGAKVESCRVQARVQQCVQSLQRTWLRNKLNAPAGPAWLTVSVSLLHRLLRAQRRHWST